MVIVRDYSPLNAKDSTKMQAMCQEGISDEEGGAGPRFR